MRTALTLTNASRLRHEGQYALPTKVHSAMERYNYSPFRCICRRVESIKRGHAAGMAGLYGKPWMVACRLSHAKCSTDRLDASLDVAVKMTDGTVMLYRVLDNWEARCTLASVQALPCCRRRKQDTLWQVDETVVADVETGGQAIGGMRRHRYGGRAPRNLNYLLLNSHPSFLTSPAPTIIHNFTRLLPSVFT